MIRARQLLSLLALGTLTLAGCAADTGDEDPALDDGAEALTTDPAYAEGQRHSQLTPAIVASLREVLAGGSADPHAFMKVGDSITESTSFLDCLDRTSLTSGAAAGLEATRTWFDGSWSRRSKSATFGWHTSQPTSGAPSPIDVEVDAMNPSFAVVMLGTNDNYVGTDRTYRINLTRVVDTLLGKHVVPILSTIPFSGKPGMDASVPRMNAIVRNIAASKKVPLMDFHLSLERLRGHGISSDTIHPNVAPHGACDFSTAGLGYGYNVRTLLALEALGRVKDAVLEVE
ncbi:MAG: hypothetical protein JWP97_6670 [Labilithrix sp.]|nr:hypothetical protein [Labilithrix sp.]